MVKFTFNDNLTTKLLNFANEISCTYHINNFDYPQTHIHTDYWEFTILTNGSIINYINGDNELYHKNTLFFSTPRDCHYIKKSENSQTLRYINIMVKAPYLTELLNQISPAFQDALLKGAHHFPLPLALISNIEQIIHKINLLTSNQHQTYDYLLRSALLLILQYLFSKTIDIFENNPPWFQKLSSITLNPTFLTYTVTDLCRELGYSNAQLTRLFRAHLNITPHEYIVKWKFRYARNLLKSTDLKIIDIAQQIGYANLSQFNITFKEKFNMTPNEYRKQNKCLQLKHANTNI